MTPQGSSYSSRLVRALFLFILIATAGNSWAAARPHDADGIENLKNAAGSGVTFSLHRASGTVSFLSLRPGALKIKIPAGADRAASTMAFLNSHGSVFGLQNPDEELELLREVTDNFGLTHVLYRQVYKGLPVFASDFRSHFDRSGALSKISATTLPIRRLNTVPNIDSSQAAEAAVSEVLRQQPQRSPSAILHTLESELLVFRTGLLQGIPGRNHLAYRVEVINASRSIREFVFVDAHSGRVLDQITGIHQAIDRQVYNGGFDAGFLAWSEGDSLPFNGPDKNGINDLIDYAEDTYNLFMTISNGTYPSFDGADATMHSVLNDPAINCPNANWNGVSTNYCNGVSGDDTVAHEWTHAYSEYTHGLIYQWQSGALNEAYSDIIGEVVDLLNGAGTDEPNTLRTESGISCSSFGSGSPAIDDSYRWLSGEDDPAFGGAIRDLWRPECYGDPGKVSSDIYWCSTGDSGGVHINSGVPNRAFSLLVDGGSHNGQQVSGLGMTRVTHIYWRAMSVYQGPATNFSAHADALEASCSDLIGVGLPALSTDTSTPSASGITIDAGDCAELSKAISAVELRTEPVQCNFQTLLENNPPKRCAGYGDFQSISLTDWEGGLGSWTSGTRDVADPDNFRTPPWAVVGDLPDDRPGMGAFVANLNIGDCETEDETAAFTLDSPAIVIPEGTLVPRISIDHWIATELGFDGGNLKISVNGGTFDPVPPAAIEVSPYNDVLISADDGNTNPLASEAAFTGSDEGVPSGSWGQSHINLQGIASAGDSIRLRFDFGIDLCFGLQGWYVDEVEFYSCSAELPPSDCGNAVIDDGEQCDDGNDFIGDGCSNTCQVENGWECTAPIPPGEVLDPSFEDGTPNAFWTESSTNFGTPVCDPGSCGTGGGTGPLDGDFWIWFGGIAQFEEGSVSQSVTIPSTVSHLTFGFEASACDSPSDYVEVLIDGQQVMLIDGSHPLCDVVGYSTQAVDISAYADDGVHELQFHSEIFANNADVSNFFVDVVALPGVASICSQGTALTLVKAMNNDNGGIAMANAWTLSADGPTPFSGSGPSVSSPADLQAGSYNLTESGGPTGYAASDWVCEGGTQDDANTITLALGEKATCTITNDDLPPSLTLVKEVSNDNGGGAGPEQWTLSATGPSLLSGSGAGISSGPDFKAGRYDLSESGGPDGYTAGDWACDGGIQEDADTILLMLGETATCTLVNDDIAPSLTLVKEVNNDDGGTAEPSEWTLTATGPTSFSGSGPSVSNPDNFSAGSYNLSESGGPQEYTPGDWVCDGGIQEDTDTVTLGPGETATCTIINDDNPLGLTLVKKVINDDSGTAEPSAWTLEAVGPTSFSGNGPTVSSPEVFLAGSYDLSESGGPEGYEASDWICSGGVQEDVDTITLAPGDSVQCTITNDDVPVDPNIFIDGFEAK